MSDKERRSPNVSGARGVYPVPVWLIAIALVVVGVILAKVVRAAVAPALNGLEMQHGVELHFV
jgi:hypothetical protein